MNDRQIAGRLRDVRRMTDYDEVLIQDLVECVQEIHERLMKIDERHNDRDEAMSDADRAMEEAAELEHGPY